MAENARTSSTPINIWARLYVQLNTASSTLTFHILGAFSSYIPSQFNAIASTLGYHLFYFTRVQFINSFNQSIAFMVPVLITFLQLKYQGNDRKTPFATHPKTMLVAVSSSVVQFLAYIVLLQFPLRRLARVAYHCFLWCGYASVASLASVFVPDSFSRFVYAIFMLVSASYLLHWLYHKLVVNEDTEFQIYRRRSRLFLNSMLGRALGSSSGRQPQILPV